MAFTELQKVVILLKVINPKELIEYKSELNGQHQIEDIEATKQYLKNSVL